MKSCQVKLYRNRNGICGDVVFPNGVFGTGCYGSDSQKVVDGFCRKLTEYPKAELQIDVKPKIFGLRLCDEPLPKETLEEITQLFLAQDYKVK